MMSIARLLCGHHSNTTTRLLTHVAVVQSQIGKRHLHKRLITQSNLKSLRTCQRALNLQERFGFPNHRETFQLNSSLRNRTLQQTWQQPSWRWFSTSAPRNFPRGTMFMDIMKEERQRNLEAEEEEEMEGGLEGDVQMEEDGVKKVDSVIRPHIPVMLKEVIAFLAPRENQVFLDMTFGAGGHTEAILQHCDKCQVIALDRDPVAYELALNMAEKYGKERLLPLLGRFSDLGPLLQKEDVDPASIDGVLIDAGCSSMQFDTAERGFALSKNGPLDMRMDGKRISNQPTAADVVNSLDAVTLSNILHTYGEEPKAKKIANNILQYREKYRPIQTTQELATVVSFAFTHKEANKNRDGLRRHAHVATKTFLALRIFVNNELNELNAGLQAVEKFAKSGSRLAVLSFHSMEDRIVKRFMQGRDVAGKSQTLHQKVAASKDLDIGDDETTEDAHWDMCKDLQMASEEEVEMNPRSRSAKLRTAIKL